MIFPLPRVKSGLSGFTDKNLNDRQKQPVGPFFFFNFFFLAKNVVGLAALFCGVANTERHVKEMKVQRGRGNYTALLPRGTNQSRMYLLLCWSKSVTAAATLRPPG